MRTFISARECILNPWLEFPLCDDINQGISHFGNGRTGMQMRKAVGHYVSETERILLLSLVKSQA